MEWYLSAFKDYAQFRGRSSRQEYWMFQLFNFIVGVALVSIDMIFGIKFNPETGLGLLSSLYFLFTFVPTIAVTVRRLHDTNRSGLWFFVLFVPVLGWIWLLYTMCKDSDHKINHYGPDPTLLVF